MLPRHLADDKCPAGIAKRLHRNRSVVDEKKNSDDVERNVQVCHAIGRENWFCWVRCHSSVKARPKLPHWPVWLCQHWLAYQPLASGSLFAAWHAPYFVQLQVELI